MRLHFHIPEPQDEATKERRRGFDVFRTSNDAKRFKALEKATRRLREEARKAKQYDETITV